MIPPKKNTMNVKNGKPGAPATATELLSVDESDE
jgi:hypothetical protein